MRNRQYLLFGTYKYGLSVGWGRCNSQRDAMSDSASTCCNIPPNSPTGVLDVPACSISVLRLTNGNCNGRGCICYAISVKDKLSSSRAVHRKIVVRREIAERLYWRFIRSMEERCSHTNNNGQSPLASPLFGSSGHDHADQQCVELPGCSDNLFLQTLSKTMLRKFNERFRSDSRTVTPYLYSLWSLTSTITVELFADSLNESGVLPNYCSVDCEDNIFGSIGSWEDVEQTIEGAGGNPPYETEFLNHMVTEFDSGARGSSPYCRCVLLPLAKKYGMLQRTTGLSSKGIMLVRIPTGSLSFKHQEGYFNPSSIKQYHEFQELGIFIWRNRPYLEKYPPPRDVELLYLNWVAVACQKPSEVHVDLQALRKAFPPLLRDESFKLDLLMNSLVYE